MKRLKNIYIKATCEGEDGKSGKILDHMNYLASASEGSVKLKNLFQVT